MLPAPLLSYEKGERPFDPGNSGSWNLRRLRFYEASALHSFGVVSFADPRRSGRDGDQGSLQVLLASLPCLYSLTCS